MKLIETVRTYQKTLNFVTSLGMNKRLISSAHFELQNLLSRGMKLEW
jgi:hypothetical protein